MYRLRVLTSFAYLWEVHQDFSHLITYISRISPLSLRNALMRIRTSLSTSNIDDDVTVGELGQRLRNDSLSASKSTRNAHSTTLNTREKCVQNTLSDDKRSIRRQLLGRRTRHPHGPAVHHAVLSLGAIEVKLQDLLVDSVASLAREAGNCALRTRWEEDLVLAEETVLENGAEDVAAGDVVANLELARCEVPFLRAVESGQIDTTGDVDALGVFGDALERALDTVVDGLHQTWAELDGQGLSRSEDGVADGYTGCLY
jgi:hypothetical protein